MPVFEPWNPNTSNPKLHGSNYDPPGPTNIVPPSPSAKYPRAPSRPYPGKR
jgi:hypothetical protein